MIVSCQEKAHAITVSQLPLKNLLTCPNLRNMKKILLTIIIITCIVVIGYKFGFDTKDKVETI